MNKFNPKKTKFLNLANYVLDVFYHTSKSKKKIVWKNVKSILVLDFTGIGDLIMLTPFLRILKKNSPSAQIDLACNSYAETMLNDQNIINRFYCFDGKTYLNSVKKLLIKDKCFKSYIDEIKKTEYDIIIEPRGDLRYIYFMNFLNGKRKISYNYTGGESLLTDVVIPDPKVSHLLEDKLVLLNKLGCSYEEGDTYPFLSKSDSRLSYSKCFIKNNDLSDYIIGMHPGASQELRRWDKYPLLLNKIFKHNPRVSFLVFCAKGEEDYADALMNKANEIGCKAVLVNESFENYISSLSLCKLVICNDSGAAHISAAFGITTLVLYGPNVPEFSRPTGKGKVINISNTFNCKPCGLDICKYNNKCIRSITVEQVFEKIQKLL